MGLERVIRIADETPASWAAIRSRLGSVGESPTLRMIDSELAFPEETPSDNWQELRVALTGGMVTLRRSQHGLTCVTWGNADPALLRAWNLLTWAAASSTGGLIQLESDFSTAEAFAAQHKLFPV